MPARCHSHSIPVSCVDATRQGKGPTTVCRAQLLAYDYDPTQRAEVRTNIVIIAVGTWQRVRSCMTTGVPQPADFARCMLPGISQ
jgi:hypothetical protein